MLSEYATIFNFANEFNYLWSNRNEIQFDHFQYWMHWKLMILDANIALHNDIFAKYGVSWWILRRIAFKIFKNCAFCTWYVCFIIDLNEDWIICIVALLFVLLMGWFQLFLVSFCLLLFYCKWCVVVQIIFGRVKYALVQKKV